MGCLTSQSKGAIGELFAEGFQLLVLFKATRRLLVSPDHTSRQEAGVLATEAASSMLPHCCPSSSRNRSTLLIHSATGLKGWPHSCWNPPPHPMMSDCQRLWFHLDGGMSKEGPGALRFCSQFNLPIVLFFLKCDQGAAMRPSAQQLHEQTHFL